MKQDYITAKERVMDEEQYFKNQFMFEGVMLLMASITMILCIAILITTLLQG